MGVRRPPPRARPIRRFSARRCGVGPQRIRPAFTVVELLVVITIIVVLASLLAPALDRASAQAELTLGAAGRLKPIADSALLYAANNKRQYMVRPCAKAQCKPSSIYSYSPANLAFGTPQPDDRPLFNAY